MDPLTHTLVGANLGRGAPAELKRGALLTGVVGANLPDVDAVTYFMRSDLSIGFRRGWTHGVLALIVLPLLLWGASRLWVHWRSGSVSPSESRLLLILSAVSVWSHPFLDWLNTYGMRWLMPFDGTWSYGDSVFIVDPWLWLILAVPLLVAVRRSWVLVAGWVIVTFLLVRLILLRADSFVVVVSAVMLLLLSAIVWSPAIGDRQRRRVSRYTLVAAAGWIVMLLSVHAWTLDAVTRELSESRDVESVFVGPRPMNPLEWDVLILENGNYEFGNVEWPDGTLRLSPQRLRALEASPWQDEAVRAPEIAGYMSWVRFPWVVAKPGPAGARVHVMDARYTRSVTSGFGGASFLVPTGEESALTLSDSSEDSPLED